MPEIWTIDEWREYRTTGRKPDKNRTSNTITDLEPDSCPEQMAAPQAPQMVTPCRISFHSLRHRLADLDNLSGKAILDGIIQTGVLPDDSPRIIQESPIHTQEKTTGEERTIITIEFL